MQRLELPPELLTCKAAPPPLNPATATDKEVAELLVRQDDAGADCRSKLERLAEIYARWVAATVGDAAGRR